MMPSYQAVREDVHGACHMTENYATNYHTIGCADIEHNAPLDKLLEFTPQARWECWEFQQIAGVTGRG